MCYSLMLKVLLVSHNVKLQMLPVKPHKSGNTIDYSKLGYATVMNYNS